MPALPGFAGEFRLKEVQEDNAAASIDHRRLTERHTTQVACARGRAAKPGNLRQNVLKPEY